MDKHLGNKLQKIKSASKASIFNLEKITIQTSALMMMIYWIIPKFMKKNDLLIWNLKEKILFFPMEYN